MGRAIFIAGAPFQAVYHRDGRFLRGPGLFAFARWTGARHILLHLELTEAINRRAVPGHPRWDWSVGQGLNELLVCLASARASLAGGGEPVDWDAGAQVWMGEGREAVEIEAGRMAAYA